MLLVQSLLYIYCLQNFISIFPVRTQFFYLQIKGKNDQMILYEQILLLLLFFFLLYIGLQHFKLVLLLMFFFFAKYYY